MNEPTLRLEVRPEVSAFVARVRARLADLSDEEREELVGGLEADIAELVADGGSVAELGDPRAYADELRSAAGIEHSARPADPVGGRSREPRRAAAWIGEAVAEALDGSRRRWTEVVEVPALREVWQLLVTLRPVWWVLRAWVAMQLFDLATQARDMTALLPMIGGPLLGSLLWVAAVVVSVQIGRNRLWPGSGARRATFSRAVLLGLNALAVVATPVVVGLFPADGTWADQGYGYTVDEPPHGLVMDGETVANVFPYDAEGNPLTGVQLFDQDGTPLSVVRYAGDDFVAGRRTVTYPWFNGEQQLYNVFPLPRRDQRSDSGGVRSDAWASSNPPYLPPPPLAVVPPAALPTPSGSGTAGEGGRDAGGTRSEPTVDESGTARDGSGGGGKRDS